MWESATLEKVCNIYSGNSINAKKKAELYTGVNGVPYVATKDIGFDGIIDYKNGVAIPQEDSVSFKVAPENTVFVCAEGGSAGRKIAISDRQVCFVNKLFALVPFDRLLPKFVYYYTLSESFQSQFKDALTGLIGGVSLSKIKKFTINFPSIEEQKRVVAILDEAFSGIDQAIANTEQNIQNARNLFESYLNSTIEKEKSQASLQQLSDICDESRAITYGVIKLGEHIDGGIPCLRTSNVRWLRIETLEMKKIAPELSEDYSRTILKGREVLVNVRGTLGGVAVVPLEMVNWNISREVAVVPNDQAIINSDYLAYCVGAKCSQDWLTGVLKGAAYTGINLEDLRTLKIPVPTLVRQAEIVEVLSNILDQCRQIENSYQHKLCSFKELKQSLLQKAFAGELTSDLSEAA